MGIKDGEYGFQAKENYGKIGSFVDIKQFLLIFLGCLSGIMEL